MPFGQRESGKVVSAAPAARNTPHTHPEQAPNHVRPPPSENRTLNTENAPRRGVRDITDFLTTLQVVKKNNIF